MRCLVSSIYLCPQVVSPLYQQLHPGLDKEWSALFVQLGARSLPSAVPRTISSSKLQRQQARLQLKQAKLLERLQQLPQGPANAAPGASARATAGNTPSPESGVSMDISGASDAADMDTSCNEEVFQPLHSQQQQAQQQGQQGQSDRACAAVFQQVTLAEAATGAYEALDAASAEVTELEASYALADIPDILSAGKDSSDESEGSAVDDIVLDWGCPDLQALILALAGRAAAHTGDARVARQHYKAMSR